MKQLTLPNTLFVASSMCIIFALGLSAGSLSKAVKWNFYNTGTNFGVEGGQIFYLYAYQNLWTSYDACRGAKDPVYAQAYDFIKKDSWRVLPRLMIMSGIGVGCASLLVLMTGTLLPLTRNKGFPLNTCRIASAILSSSSGSIMAYTLSYYKDNYPSLLSPSFHDPDSFYPDEDNLSTGFYMVACACALLFISATANIFNVIVYLKTNNNVIPTKETSEGAI